MTIDLLTAARDLIAIDSRSSLSDRAVVDYLAPLCRTAGLSVALQTEHRDGVPQHNLLARRGDPATPPALLLATHLDTVPPGDPALWTETGGDAHRLTERDGLLFGLGTADVKLDFLCKLLALERLKETALAEPVLLAGTYGEEVGRWGAKLLARETSPPPAAALVGEATRLRPCTAHKGYAEIRCSARAETVPAPDGPCRRLSFAGVAAHSSQVHKGISANDACLDALAALAGMKRPVVVALHGGDLVNKVAAHAEMTVIGDLPADIPGAAVSPVERPARAAWSPALVSTLLDLHRRIGSLRRALLAYEAPGFDPPYSTVNNGLVSLDDGELGFSTDVRCIPDSAAAAALTACLDDLGEAAAPPGDHDLVIRLVQDDPPFAAVPGSPLLDHLHHVLAARHLPLEPELKSGTTEATVLRQAGIDTLVFGPGVATGNIHRPNEHVPLDHLYKAVDIYEAVIRRVCGG